MPTPIKIEPPWVRVDLNRDPVLGTCCEHCLSVDLVPPTTSRKNGRAKQFETNLASEASKRSA